MGAGVAPAPIRSGMDPLSAISRQRSKSGNLPDFRARQMIAGRVFSPTKSTQNIEPLRPSMICRSNCNRARGVDGGMSVD